MLIESDLIIAHLKKEDWLKPYADKIFQKISKGEIKVEISTEVFHELTYVMLEFTDIDTIVSNFAYLSDLENVKFIAPTPQVYILATTILKQYNIRSVFDAIYAAQTLIQVKDKTIISSDHIYDRIIGIKRVDPRTILRK